MPLINTAVPNLIQGVSQQPDATRFAGQCEEQENALSSVASGLMKRPNTRHVGKLMTSAIDSNSFIHFINRDKEEKYVVINNGTDIRAFNLLTGVEASIKVGDTTYKSSESAGAYPVASTYLNTNNPREDLKAITISDTTILLNTTTPVGISTATSPESLNQAIVFVNQGDYLTNYGFVIEADIANQAPVDAEIAFKIDLLSNNRHRIRAGSVTVHNHFAGLEYIGDPNYAIWYTRGGTQYSVGDTIDLELPQTLGSNASLSKWSLTLYRSPTVKVTNVDTSNSNKITGLQLIDEGDFVYIYENGTTRLGDGYEFGRTTQTYTPNMNGLPPTAANPATAPATGSASASSTTIDFTGYRSGSSTNPSANTNRHAKTDVIAHHLAGGTYDSIYVSSAAKTNGDGTLFHTHFENDFDDGSGDGANLRPHVNNLVEIIPRTQNAVANDDGSFDAKTPVDFNIRAEDGLGGEGLKVIHKEVSSIADLPTFCKKGMIVKVVGDADLLQDDYYVKFDTAMETFGEGTWQETIAPNIRTSYDESTLPLELVNDDVDSFILRPMKFQDRVAGDDDTNPFPSFVGNTINNVFLFKNRLGLLASDTVILSESGFGVVDENNQLVYNFTRNTVSSLLDSAPIDISVSSPRVQKLKAAKGFQENLIIFSENGQFVLKGGDVLTPKTVSVTPITNFSFEDQVDPLPLGSYIYFPFTRGNFTGMREFTVNATTDIYDSTEITEHVPAYVPKNIIDMAGTTAEDMIVLLSGDEKGSLYIYNYFWNNNQKVLSAWSKFTFTGEIRGVEFIESTLYAVITNNGETNLVELPLESGITDSAGFVTHLDMRVAKTVTHGDNEITLPYTPADNSVEVYTTDGLKLNATNLGGTVTLTQAVNDVDADGNDIDTNVFVGIPYTMKYTFSEQLFKAKAGNSTSPSNAAKLLIRNGSIYFDKTAHFKVKVTPKFRDTYENVFTPNVIGSSSIGTLQLDTGFFRFPVLTKAQDTTITIENDSALPSNLQSAEFESFMHSRSSRYA